MDEKRSKWTKPPYQPSGAFAANNNPATWSTYPEVLAAIGTLDGPGLMLRDQSLVCLDLDKCRNPETEAIEPWAQDIMARLPGAYTEVTVSGTGIRIIATGTGDKAGDKAGDNVGANNDGAPAPKSGATKMGGSVAWMVAGAGAVLSYFLVL